MYYLLKSEIPYDGEQQLTIVDAFSKLQDAFDKMYDMAVTFYGFRDANEIDPEHRDDVFGTIADDGMSFDINQCCDDLMIEVGEDYVNYYMTIVKF